MDGTGIRGVSPQLHTYSHHPIEIKKGSQTNTQVADLDKIINNLAKGKLKIDSIQAQDLKPLLDRVNERLNSATKSKVELIGVRNLLGLSHQIQLALLHNLKS